MWLYRVNQYINSVCTSSDCVCMFNQFMRVRVSSKEYNELNEEWSDRVFISQISQNYLIAAVHTSLFCCFRFILSSSCITDSVFCSVQIQITYNRKIKLAEWDENINIKSEMMILRCVMKSAFSNLRITLFCRATRVNMKARIIQMIRLWC